MASMPSSANNSPRTSPAKQRTTRTATGPDVPDEPPSLCPKCQKDLESATDSVVVAFAGKMYHVDCFRCAKCHSLVEHEANLLLLSDGSPVCENCSYICSLCKIAITNEAIVTGDESYHSECFKCRSCSNRIEELVFAKTTAGLYCMSCHNERVSRSRRHMEARRNKSLKSSSRQHHINGRSRTTSSNTSSQPNAVPPRNDSPNYTTSPEPNASPLLDAQHITRSRQESTTSTFSFDSASEGALTNGRLTPTPLGISPTKGGILYPIGNAREVIKSASSPTSPTQLHIKLDPKPHSRSPSPTGPLSPQFQTESFNGQTFASEKGLPERPLSPFGKRPATASAGNQSHQRLDSEPLLSMPRQYESLPQLNLASQSAPPSRTSFEKSRRSSLMPAPTNKAANRRSGFYGAPMVGMPESSTQNESLAEADENSQSSPERTKHSEKFTSPPESPTTPMPFTPPRSKPTVSVQIHTVDMLSAESPSRLSDTEDRGRALSFYDPDMLGFLDNIPPTPDMPKSPKLDDSPYLSEYSPNLHINTGNLDDEASGSDQDFTAPLAAIEDTQSPVARELRESIRQSRGAKSDMTLDVTLVETLIAELEETKDRMKKLQGEYMAMKRASSQVMQGIHEFRDEYEREAEMRREAQNEMSQLRAQLHQQAHKLVSLESAKREQAELQARQSDLRSSVYGIEKELSTLKAKRDIAMAEVEELQHQRGDSGASSERFSDSLGDRLEDIKREYKQELEHLAVQKETAAREIQDMARERDAITQEVKLLEERAADLERQNLEAITSLQNARDALASLQSQRLPNPSVKAHHRPLANSHTSNSSVGSNSYDTIPEAGLIQAQRIDVAPNVRKFKWGKAKPSDGKTTPQIQRVQQSSGTLSATRNATSTDSIRQHVFQPTSILRPVRCEHCGDKMWGLQELRCGACYTYCHAKCAPHYNIHCNSAPSEDITPIGVVFGNDLVRQVAAENGAVPHVVTACISAVEEHGMDFEGIYRKTGGMGQVKQITQGFELSDTFTVDDGNCDISAVTSVLKNYFRALENPLYTFQLHDEFVAVVEAPNSDRRKIEALENLIHRLPEAHIATMRALMLHLHGVHLRSDENKMTPANLGVVFSPTLLRSHIAGREFSDINHRARVVELCVEHAPQIFGN